MRSLFEPCGSWQLAQLSRPAAWSCRNGPRFSAWQLAHVSLMVLPTLSMRTLVEPCGVWQVVQSILPSRTGMCPDFLTFMASCLWQVSQVCTAVTVLSCARSDFGLCTLWQLAHETLRASCMPPFHCACEPLLWHVRQVELTSRALIAVKRRMSSFLPESTCFWPGPWQVSQLWPVRPAGVWTFCSLPCCVARRLFCSPSWQVAHVSSPTKLPGCGCAEDAAVGAAL